MFVCRETPGLIRSPCHIVPNVADREEKHPILPSLSSLLFHCYSQNWTLTRKIIDPLKKDASMTLQMGKGL